MDAVDRSNVWSTEGPGLRVPVRASARAYADLREGIVSLRLPPGTPLPEPEIARQLGFSRTPVREALIRLAEEGLVLVMPQVGTYVSKIDLAEVRSAQFIREALECATVRTAAAAMTDTAVKRLRRTLHEQADAAEMTHPAEFYALDELLHRQIADIAGQPKAWRLVHSAKAQLDRVRHLDLTAAHRHGDIVAEHAAIVAALEEQDADAAELRLRVHLRAVFQAMTGLLDGYAGYFVDEAVPLEPPARERRHRRYPSAPALAEDDR